VIDRDGSNARNLTRDSATNYEMAWSPDGRRIVFASTREGDWEIYVMAADGAGSQRLTYSPGRDAHPAFTPDGSRIMFQSPRDYGIADEVDLYVMDADGGNQRRLVVAPGFDGVPVPSPDGQRIAFQRGARAGADAYHWDLYLVDSTGRNERSDSEPVEQPGTKLGPGRSPPGDLRGSGGARSTLPYGHRVRGPHSAGAERLE